MIKILFKHKILELCIDKFFSTVRKNFPTNGCINVQVSTIGDHNIHEFIDMEIIDLKLDPAFAEYVTSHAYTTLSDGIQNIVQEFPVKIKQGDEPHTAKLYRGKVNCGVMQFKSNLIVLEADQQNINNYLYLVMVKS